jgi:adenine-specific DNA-methyltransferase
MAAVPKFPILGNSLFSAPNHDDNFAIMKKLDLRDPETESRDPIPENLERTKELFPEAWTEGKISFDVLKQLLGASVDESEEKYGLNWHGKRRARQLALTPSTGTLRPRRDESVDWDTTQNLIIEGDNLEVLKLLQKSYAGKVKLIYIDPPYNTGNDLVYLDDYRDNIRSYLEMTNQLEGGNKIRSNTEASGRFHTAWLNMIYPRLKLARSLMRPDGLICLSIDDNERDNLKSVCDEIFGEENFIESIIWKKRYGGGAKEKHLVSVHEYVLVYAKDASELGELYVPQSPEAIERYYTRRDDNFETRGPYRTHPLEATKSMGDRHNLVFPIRGPDGIEITPKRQWLWSRERVASALANNEIEFAKDREGFWTAHSKQYLREPTGEVRSAKAFSIIDDVYSQHGTNELLNLFGNAHIFPFPKPTGLIRPLLEFGAPDPDSIILDFFAGSGTTADALMAWNTADNGNRRFILVQLPEPIDATKEKAAARLCDELKRPRNIAELTKERVRRSAHRIKDANPLFSGDLGFRVFALDTSNFRPWQPEGGAVEQLLVDAADHLVPERSEQDIFFELILKLGLDLSARTESFRINDTEVTAVQRGPLIACLTDSIRQRDVDLLAHVILELRETLPAKDEVVCVFRDSAFENDVAKVNMAAILDQHGLLTVRSI